MIGKKSAVDNGHNDNLPDHDADRELPSVNGSKTGKNKVIPLIFIVLSGLLVLYIVWSMNSGPTRAEKAQAAKVEEEAKTNAVTGRMPELKAPERAPYVNGTPLGVAPGDQVPAPADALVDPQPMPAQGGKAYSGAGARAGQEEKPEWMLIRERRMGSGLRADFEHDDRDSGAARGAAAGDAKAGQPNDMVSMLERIYSGAGGAAGAGGGEDEEGGSDGFVPGAASLTNSLQPTRTTGTVASLVFDRNLLLAKGSFLDCVLETRLDSTVPGMTACVLSRNIYSDNGKVVLLERGSRIVGQYQGGITQGQARIFVLWTRVQTPKGVVIDLDSPGTDALGASGLDGFIDTQFWKRFGGAMLLSLVDDVARYATPRRGNGNSITFESSSEAASDMATEALKNTINIPPILRKNQGDHINIYVARDLDFRSVYALRNR